MPFITINRKSLVSVLSICSQISPRRSEVEFFTFTKIILNQERLVLESMSNDIYGKFELDTKSVEGLTDSVELLVKTEMLAGSTSVLTDEDITMDINTEKNTIILQDSKSKHTLRIQNENINQFLAPTTGQLETSITINSKEFINAYKIASASVGIPKNVYQPEFLNICLSTEASDNSLTVVASDRFRVAKTTLVSNYSQSTQEIDNNTKNYLLNPKSLSLATSILDEESFQLNLYEHRAVLLTKLGEVSLRYGSGKFPDFNKIIPSTFSCSFILKNSDLLNSLKQVYLLAKTNTINKSVTLKVEPETSKLSLSTKTKEGFSSESSLLIEKYEGGGHVFEQSFNADYLLDYVNFAGNTNLLWESNPGKPSVLSIEGKKDRQLYLVSGLR